MNQRQACATGHGMAFAELSPDEKSKTQATRRI
jgi:hypothetical protein